MPRFAANLDWLYPELPYLDRIDAAAADGFSAVESLSPYAAGAAAIATRLRDCGLPMALINAPAGDWAAGERGLACLPSRAADFRASLLTALDFAARLATTADAPLIHVMSGIAPAGADPAALLAQWLSNLGWAVEQAAAAGLRLTIEPINRRDMPGYWLHGQAQALALIDEVGDDKLLLQLDLYHCQITEGAVLAPLQAALDAGRLGHVQIAGVPDRHEPDAGELAPEAALCLLDERAWPGRIGCEYRPRGDTSAGLAWLRRWQPRP